MIYQLGVPRAATVSEVVSGNKQRFQRCRNGWIQGIIERIQTMPVPTVVSGEDLVLWRQLQDSYKDKVSACQTWDQIRVKKKTVDWTSLVLFAQSVPRFAFTICLAIKDQLSTGSRSRRWGCIQPCMFCGEPDESWDHLFFACPYTSTVWTDLIGSSLGLSPNPDWSITLSRLKRTHLDVLDSILLRMAFQTIIYYLWHKRNVGRHNQVYHLMAYLVRSLTKQSGTVQLPFVTTTSRGSHQYYNISSEPGNISFAFDISSPLFFGLSSL